MGHHGRAATRVQTAIWPHAHSNRFQHASFSNARTMVGATNRSVRGIPIGDSCTINPMFTSFLDCEFFRYNNEKLIAHGSPPISDLRLAPRKIARLYLIGVDLQNLQIPDEVSELSFSTSSFWVH